MPVSLPNSTFDNLLESSHLDDSNKWSNIGFDEETRGQYCYAIHSPPPIVKNHEPCALHITPQCPL